MKLTNLAKFIVIAFFATILASSCNPEAKVTTKKIVAFQYGDDEDAFMNLSYDEKGRISSLETDGKLLMDYSYSNSEIVFRTYYYSINDGVIEWVKNDTYTYTLSNGKITKCNMAFCNHPEQKTEIDYIYDSKGCLAEIKAVVNDEAWVSQSFTWLGGNLAGISYHELREPESEHNPEQITFKYGAQVVGQNVSMILGNLTTEVLAITGMAVGFDPFLTEQGYYGNSAKNKNLISSILVSGNPIYSMTYTFDAKGAATSMKFGEDDVYHIIRED